MMKKNLSQLLCVAVSLLAFGVLSVKGMEKNTLFINDQFVSASRVESVQWDANGNYTSPSYLLGSGSYTLSAWVKVNTASTALSHRYLVIMEQARNNGAIFRLYYDMTLGQFVFGRDSTNVLRDDRYLHATPTDAAAWNFVTAVYDREGQEIRLYVNGVLCDSKAASDTITLQNNNPLRVGFSWDGTADRFFRGHMAEMSIWGKALDEAQIQSIMGTRPAGEELADCIAYWTLSAGGKTMIIDDYSGHGNVLKMDNPNHAITGTVVTDFPEFEESSSKNVVYFSRRSADTSLGMMIRPQGDRRIIATNESFAISGWVKLSPKSEEWDSYTPIFTQDPSSSRKIRLYYEKATQSFVFERMEQSGDAPESNALKAQCLTPSEWTFVTAVYDKENKTRSLYLNGVLAASMEDEEDFVPNCSFFRFGYSYVGGKSHYFRGYLAEWSVWDSAICAEKIQAIMSTRPVDAELAGCLGYWTFDEPFATTCTDLSPDQAFPLTITDTKRIIPATECADFPAFSTGRGIPYSVRVVMPTGDIATLTENSQTEREDGKYYEGSTVSFTAQSTTHEFVRWYGDVPENQVSNATISVVIQKDMQISPYFRPTQWTYDAANGTITDGYWVLGVTVSGNTMTTKEQCVKNDPVAGLLDFTLPIENGAYSLVAFGTRSFNGNSIVREVFLPNTLTTIGQSAFNSCSSLEKVTPFLPDSVTVIGSSAFNECRSLKGDLVIQSQGAPLTWVNENNFSYTKIQSIVFGANVTTVGQRAFRYCEELTNVVFQGAIESIGLGAFVNCSKLERVTPFLPDSIKEVSSHAFSGCSKLDGDLVIAAKKRGVTLGSFCFDYADLKSIYLGPGVQTVPERAFRGMMQVTNLTVRGATTFEHSPFAYGHALKDVFLETKPTWTNPFYDCANFTRIHLASTNEEWTDFIEDPVNMTPWNELSANEKAIYTSRYEGEPEPLGRFTMASGFNERGDGGWVLRWKVPSDLDKVTVLMVR